MLFVGDLMVPNWWLLLSSYLVSTSHKCFLYIPRCRILQLQHPKSLITKQILHDRYLSNKRIICMLIWLKHSLALLWFYKIYNYKKWISYDRIFLSIHLSCIFFWLIHMLVPSNERGSNTIGGFTNMYQVFHEALNTHKKN